MGRIVNFPSQGRGGRPGGEPDASSMPELPSVIEVRSTFLNRTFSVAWILFVLAWPLTQRVIAFDLLFQFLRAMYYWNIAGMHAGLSFLIHFVGAGVLTHLVATTSIKEPSTTCQR